MGVPCSGVSSQVSSSGPAWEMWTMPLGTTAWPSHRPTCNQSPSPAPLMVAPQWLARFAAMYDSASAMRDVFRAPAEPRNRYRKYQARFVSANG